MNGIIFFALYLYHLSEHSYEIQEFPAIDVLSRPGMKQKTLFSLEFAFSIFSW